MACYAQKVRVNLMCTFIFGRVPGHLLFAQEVTSLSFPPQSRLLQSLFLLLSPPPQDFEQEVQEVHCVHSRGWIANEECQK